MNILILNDDGPASHGLRLLREAAKRHWRHSHIVTMVPGKNHSGGSMSVSGAWRRAKAKQVGKEANFFQFSRLTPVELAVHAFVERRQYLSYGRRDLVLVGVNLGGNVGMNVFISGTVGVAMYVTKAFGVPAWAFSQATGRCGEQVPKLKGDAEKEAFRNAAKLLPVILKTTKPWPGDCVSVNFPAEPAKGPIETEVAAYDPYIGKDHVPHEARKAPRDVEYLDDGYMTISRLHLTANPPQL